MFLNHETSTFSVRRISDNCCFCDRAKIKQALNLGLLMLIGVCFAGYARAVPLVWDLDTGDAAIVTDGSGNWQVGQPNWNDAGADVSWTDGSDAVFGGGTLGSSGVVTLGSAISAESLTFNTPNGGGTYTIDTSTFALTLNSGITANESASIQSGVGGSIILGAANSWDVADTKELTVDAIISGTGLGITKTGLGTLTLTGANTFTGDALVNAGTLKLVNEAITVTNSTVLRQYAPIAVGATLEFNHTTGATISNAGAVNLNGGGTFKKSGNGALTQVSGGATIAMDGGSLIWIAEGTYQFGAQGVGTWTNNKSDFQVDTGATYIAGATPTVVNSLNGGGTIQLGGGGTRDGRTGFAVGVLNGDGNFSGTLTNNPTYGPNSFRKEGIGTQILSGNNDYDGITTIVAGTLQIGDGGATGTLGTGDTVNDAALVFNHTGDHIYAGSISGSGTVTKLGSGTQTLNGNNTYTTDTMVDAGTLNLGGTNTSKIIVADNANLGGEGSTTGDIVFQGTHALLVDADPANALETTGLLDLSVVPSNGITVNVEGFGADAFDVIRYGTLTGQASAGNFVLGTHTLSDRVTVGVLADDTINGAITLDLGYRTNTWTGAGTNPTFWDINTTANWSNTTDTVFYEGDAPVFADGASNLNPTLQSNISAGTVTFSNTTGTNYTLLDNGGGETLTTANGLNISGSGDVTLDAAIVSDSLTSISGSGTVSILKGFANNGGINFSGDGTTTVSGIISGAADIVQSGTGFTEFTAANTYSSVVTVENGTLRMTHLAILGGKTYGPIGAGAVLEFNTNSGSRNASVFSLSGGGTFRKIGGSELSQTSAGATISMDSGALFHIAQGRYTFGGGGIGSWANNKADLLVDVTGIFRGSATPTVFDAVNGEGILQFGGGITLGGDNGDGTFTGIVQNDNTLNNDLTIRNSVTKVGTGTQILSGANTYNGNTIINAGLLVVNGTVGGAATNMGGTTFAGITVADGANIGGEASTTGNVIFQGTTHTLEVDSDTVGALGSTGAGSLDVSALNTGGFLVNIAGTGPAPVQILTFGSGGFIGDVNRFTLGTHTFSGRVGSAGSFTQGASAITIDLGFATRTWDNGSADGFWNEGAGSSQNWVEGDQLFYDLDSVVFDDTPGSSQTVTLNENVNATIVTFNNSSAVDYTLQSATAEVVQSTAALNIIGSGNVTLDNVVGGTTEIFQKGTGVTTLVGASISTGATTVTSGTLRISNEANLGADPASFNAGQLTLDGATATLNTTATFSINDPNRGVTLGGAGGIIDTDAGTVVTIDVDIANDPLNGGGTLEKRGLGVLELTQNNSYTGLTTVSEGTLRLINNGSSNGITPDRNYGPIAAGATLEFNYVNGPGSASIDLFGGGTFKKSGTGSLQMTSAGSIIDMDSGALFHIEQGNYIFGGGGIGDWTGNLSDMQVDFGATYTGQATPTVIDALNGAGTVVVGGVSDKGVSGLTLGVDNGDGVFTGDLTNNATYGLNTVTKEGTGTQTLSGNNSYAGATQINGGLLNLNGALTGDITVASVANIGGEATTEGTLLFQGTTHVLAIDATTPGALGSTGAGTTDISALNVGGLTVDVIGTGPGAIPVLVYGSGGLGTTGSVDRLTLGMADLSARIGTASFVDDTLGTISIDLGYVENTWVGGDGTNPTFWDVGTTSNWSNTSDAVFQQGDDVIFGDTGVMNFNPTLQADITAGTVTFNNTAPNLYTLDKAVAETLTTNGALTLAGAGVTLNVGIEAKGGVVVSGVGTMTINGILSGSSGLTKSGSGNTILNASNTYTGATEVSAGTLTLGTNNAIDDASEMRMSGGVINLNGQTETLHSITQTAGTVELRNADVTLLDDSSFTNITNNTGDSVIRIADGKTITAVGGISQIGDNDGITFDTQGTAVADVSAAINTGNGNGYINKTGSGTLRLTSNASQFGGGTVVEEGVLEFTSIIDRNPTPSVDVDSSLGDADFADILQVGSASTAATLRMIGTNAENSSDRSVQLGEAGGTIDVEDAAQTLSLTGVISDVSGGGAGSLTKAGLGTLVSSGTNTYSGSSTITGGTLQIDGDNTGTATGAVTVGPLGALAGTGTVGGITSVITGGVIRPGGSAGADRGELSFASDLNAAFGSLVFTAVDATTRGTSYDAVKVGGLLTLDGTTNLQLIADTGFTVASGDILDLLDWTTLTATGFDVGTDGRTGGTGGGNLDLPDLSIFSLAWDVSGFLTTGQLLVIPEPSRAMLLLLGLFSLTLRRRR